MQHVYVYGIFIKVFFVLNLLCKAFGASNKIIKLFTFILYK